MSDKLHCMFTYQVRDDLAGDADLDFYKSLPDADLKYYDAATNKSNVPRRDAMQAFGVVGSAILSSTVLASIIKSYLQSRRSTIRITIDKSRTTLDYEGPNIKHSEETIAKAIQQLADKAPSASLKIEATKPKQETKQ